MARKVADCRDFPSDNNCTLTISGEEDEVVRAASDHAVSVHGHDRGPDLEGDVRGMLKDEMPNRMATDEQNTQQARSARH